MTTPDNEVLMPIGAPLSPASLGNFLQIGAGSATAIDAPAGVVSVDVSWEGTERLYLWATRDGASRRVIARDDTGGGANPRAGGIACLLPPRNQRRESWRRRPQSPGHVTYHPHTQLVSAVV